MWHKFTVRGAASMNPSDPLGQGLKPLKIDGRPFRSRFGFLLSLASS
ncbi:MAG: hypothetical protein QXQ21_08215 [Candidatus Jordarchaeales archaeon]